MQAPTINEIPGYCTLCRSRCGTLNTVQNGQLISVRPDRTHPTGNAMCMKGRAAPELVHSPHRLRYPMRRTRPKNADDPGWERISWETALSEVAARLDAIRTESGAEAVVFGVTTPSGTPLSDSIDWIERFARHFGSPNICYATEICNWHKDFAHAFTFGCGMPTPDVERADLILLWGHNPASTWLAMANAVADGRTQQARLIIVDPRETALARDAEHWLAVRPGTDAALALGFIRALIAHDQIDHAFVRQWTNAAVLVRRDNGAFLTARDLGLHDDAHVMLWDEEQQCALPIVPENGVARCPQSAALRGHFDIASVSGEIIACRPAFALLEDEVAVYTAAHVAELTTVPEAVFLAAAAAIGAAVAANERIAYHAWSGVAQHTNATQTERAIAVLYALTGSFDDDGGNRAFPTQPINPVSVLSDLAPAQRAKALGLRERPIGPPARGWVTARDTYRAILKQQPYAVRAFFGFGSNPLSSQADTAMAREAFQALPFHVHCDLFETPTSRYADIVLPIGTPWEREGLRIGFELNDHSQSRVQLRRQMVQPQGEARSDNDIVFDLACRLGMSDAFFGGSLEAGWNHMLAPLGVTVETLRQNPQGLDLPLPPRRRFFEQQGFATETRLVELYSHLLLRHGQSALPNYCPPAEAGAAALGFPIVLSSAKNGYFCHSQHRSLVSLRKRAPLPLIEIPAGLATKRDICSGDLVLVTTRSGQARFVADVSPSLAPGTVVAEFGWWQACPEIGYPGFPLEGAENRHFNGLISSEAHDPISGSVAHRSFRCQVVRDPDFDPARRAWQEWRSFVVRKMHLLADGVMALRFEASDGGMLPDFEPGQHVTVRVQGCKESDDGRDSKDSNSSWTLTLTRAYSLTGAARVAQRRHYTIAVRFQKGQNAEGLAWEGAMSSHLHLRMREGMSVELRAPSGRFTLPVASPQPLILIAGGIGITPFISQLESIAQAASMAIARGQRPDMPRIILHYANRNDTTHAFRERLSALSDAIPSLTIVDYYDTEPTAKFAENFKASNKPPRRERISDAVIDDKLIALRARVYMCGPAPMMQAVRAGLLARGMPNFDIFHEAFQSAAVLPSDAEHRTHTVIFRRSARTAQWTPKDGNLLAFAEKLGLALPNGCRVGQCESCSVRVLKGSGAHLNGEPPDDPDTLLTCQGIPLTDLEIDA